MKISNKHKLPKSIFDTIKLLNEEYDNEGSNISASSIDVPPRIYWLNKRHGNEITVDARDLFRSFLGTAAHSACEHAAKQNPDLIVEVRYAKDFLGWKVSAKIDQYNKKTKKLTDLKFSSIYSLTNPPKDSYIAQLNTQAYLLQEHGIEVKSMELDISAVDWYLSRTKQSDYPQSPTKSIKVPKWTHEETEKYITERVSLLQQYENIPDDELPPCSEADKWAKPSVWAVYKDAKAKRATKLFTNPLEAEIFSKQIGGRLEYRQGEETRCLDYCSICEYCSHWKEKYGEDKCKS